VPLAVYLATLLVSAGLAWALTPVAIRLGTRKGWVAVPGGRRKHHGNIPRIGGFPLYPAFAAASLFSLLLPTNDVLEPTRLQGVLLSLAVVWVVGWIDDVRELPAWQQLLGLLAAGGIAIGHKVFIEVFNSPFSDEQIRVAWYVMVPLTLFWLAGMSSTMNLVDGLDGLAIGISALASLVLFIHMLRLGQYSVAVLPLALTGCCLGFLPYNIGPARIFLGGGAQFLGFALGAVSIVAGAKVASALLVVWVPLVDASWQAYWRWHRGLPIAVGDRGHLHMRLQDLGWPSGRIVLIYCAVTAILGAVALLVSSRLLKLAVLLGVALIVLAFLAVLARRGQPEAPSQPPSG